MTMEKEIRSIRKQLRAAMNGVISNSLREKGMNYKLIFGVPLPDIKRIAAEYTPNAELARALWNEDVREMKILGTLLFPAEAMTHAEARRWVNEIPYPEIAEQCCNNLFPKLADAAGLAVSLLADTSMLGRMSGFLLFAQLYKHRQVIFPAQEEVLLAECFCTLQPENEAKASWHEQRAAVQALRFFGRISPGNAAKALETVLPDPETATPEQREFYEELRFEFTY